MMCRLLGKLFESMELVNISTFLQQFKIFSNLMIKSLLYHNLQFIQNLI